MNKKRQKLRRGLIVISFFLFPVTIYYLSPVLIIMGASEGVIVGSFIAFIALFMSALILGRGFCGWVCPAAGLQEICFLTRDNRVRGGKLDWIKYFIWVPWLGGIAFAAVAAGGFHSIEPFYQIKNGISVSDLPSLVIYFFFVTLIVVLALGIGKRAFCHYVCWMAPFIVIGNKIRNTLRWPALHLITDKDKCIECKKCTKECPMSLEVEAMALKGSMDNSECILCGTCVDVCPKDVIAYTMKSGK